MVSTLVRLRDFAEDGAAAIIPKTSTIGVARAQVAYGTTTLVSDRETLTTIVDGTVMLTMDPDTVYRVRLPNTDGFRQKVWVRTTTADLPLVELYRSHQIDPATLDPLVALPPSTQELLEQANDILEQLQSYGYAVAIDPADVDALEITYPDQMIDPADADAIVFTTGA
jgi:hypothetical protein